MLAQLLGRQLGVVTPWQFQWDEYERLMRFHSLVPDIKNFCLNTHRPFSSIDLSQSHAECGRYLLTVGSDSLINLFDLDRSLCAGPIASVSKPETHKFAISSACWYSVDNGMFTTGSMDQSVGVWDARRMKCVRRFDIKDRVYTHAMSPIPTAQHTLIACGTGNPTIQMCDLRAKSTAQTLIGHKDAVLALQWSPIDAYQLVSAGKDQSIRVWDIRSSGRRALTALRRPALSSAAGEAAAHQGAIIGLQFTEDGRWLVSSGHDQNPADRLYLWDLQSHLIGDYASRNDVSHFQFPLHNLRQNTVRMAITPMTAAALKSSRSNYRSPLLFHPTDTGQVMVLDMLDGGKPIELLSMHIDAGRAVVWDRFRDRLLSVAADGMLLSWNFARLLQDEEEYYYGKSVAEEIAWQSIPE